jgi:hypothetical protein
MASSVAAQKSATPSKTPIVGKDYRFDVDAQNVWLDTGLDIPKGDLVHVYGGVLDCGAPVSPSKNESLPLPSAPTGALLMKLHDDGKPVLASPDAEMPALDNSRLYLGINGGECTGKLPARVHVRKP